MCLKKQVRSWIPAVQPATYRTDEEKTFASSSKKWVRERKKNIACCKPLCINTVCKILQRFLKTVMF